jgi:hypothetical protein
MELLIDRAGDKAKELLMKTDIHGDTVLHSWLHSVDYNAVEDGNPVDLVKLIIKPVGDDAAQLITQVNNMNKTPLFIAHTHLKSKELTEYFMKFNPDTTTEELLIIQALLKSDEELVADKDILYPKMSVDNDCIDLGIEVKNTGEQGYGSESDV